MTPDSFAILIDQLQHASMNDGQWERWSTAAVEAFGADGGTFMVLDSQNGVIRRQHQFFRTIDVEALEAEYVSGPYLMDPALGRAAKPAGSELFSDFYEVESANPMHRAFMDWRRGWRISPHHVTATLDVGPTLRAIWCLSWAPDHGPSRITEKRDFAAIVPHLGDALRFGYHHQQALQAEWWERQGGGSEQEAMALVDERGFIARMSPAFEAVARRGGWLSVSRDWLRVRDPEADRALQSALFRAVSGLETRTVSIAIPQSSRVSATLDVKPVARARRYLVPHEAAALLHLTPRTLRRAAPADAAPGARL